MQVRIRDDYMPHAHVVIAVEVRINLCAHKITQVFQYKAIALQYFLCSARTMETFNFVESAQCISPAKSIMYYRINYTVWCSGAEYNLVYYGDYICNKAVAVL